MRTLSKIAVLAFASFAAVSATAQTAAPPKKSGGDSLKTVPLTTKPAEPGDYAIDPDSGVISGGPEYPAVKPSEWTALGKLPDWSGDWAPNVAFMGAQNKANPPPWNEAAKEKAKAYAAALAKGEPPATTASKCLPPGMPALMNQNHTFEFVYSPRKIFVFDEIDGNHLRRIYTDGRPQPADPDLSYMGYSVGHWEGKALVVHTTGILPEVPFRVNDSYNIESGGDTNVIERIYLKDNSTLEDDLEVTNPHVLNGTWKYARQFKRHREKYYELIEAVCAQSGHDSVDAQGRAFFDFEGHK